jgi:hypothetical protein
MSDLSRTKLSPLFDNVHRRSAIKGAFNLQILLLAMLFALACSAGCCGQPATHTTEQTGRVASQSVPQEGSQWTNEIKVSFTGTVRIVEKLGLRGATVYPVELDARFLLVVDVLSVEHDKTPIRVGKEISFAIHSPARLFGTSAEDAVGKTCQFTAAWCPGPKKRFSWLEVRPLKD